MKRKQWFLGRIGQRVFRNRSSCPCKVCEGVFLYGVTVEDAMSADYLQMIEADMSREGEPLRYFDTIEEAKAFDEIVTSWNLKGKEPIICIEPICQKHGIYDAIKIGEFSRIVNNYLRLVKLSEEI